MAAPTFSERLARRKREWWRTSRSPVTALHRFRDLRSTRSRTDPEEVWRCCASWQRTLLNKWNAREFAARHGCPIPELYWYGGVSSRPPFESFPDQFVIRPVRGGGMNGVYAVSNGVDLIRGGPATVADLDRRYALTQRLRRRAPLLIEEFARSEDGAYRLPVEFKIFTFGGAVAAVERIERPDLRGLRSGTHNNFTPEWEPMPAFLREKREAAGPIPPPACLAEILHQASVLGALTETHMRVDFFATDRGCLFNEFSSVTANGEGFTPYADEYFGAFWEEHIPDRV